MRWIKIKIKIKILKKIKKNIMKNNNEKYIFKKKMLKEIKKLGGVE
jgi:hypothetical protein